MGEKSQFKKGVFFSKIFIYLKERRIIETLTAFIAGGWLILEFVHWILIDHYHFPEKILDITFITIVCCLICTLIWRSSRVSPARRRLKWEIIFIPLVILMTLLADSYLFLQIKKPQEGGPKKIIWKNSIAVLPFKDLSQKHDQDFFCEGMTDDIVNRLASISGLKVVSLASTRQYKNQAKNLTQIGEELKVAHILEGSLQMEGDYIRVNVNLNDVRNGFSLWSKKYERTLKSYFQIEDDIADSICRELQLQIVEADDSLLKKREPESFEAYKAYQKARLKEEAYRFFRRPEDFETSLKMFKQALEEEPNYCLAHWGLGNLYESRFVRENRPEDFDLMSQYYRRSFEINPGLAETNLGMGWIYFYLEEMEISYEYFRRAIEINPASAQANFEVGSFLRSLGLYSSALRYYLRSIELDPLSLRTYLNSADCCLYLGKYKEACQLLFDALALSPENPRPHLGLVRNYLMLGDYGLAEKELDLAEYLGADPSLARRHRAWLLAARDEKEMALSLIKPGDKLYGYDLTSILARTGKTEEAIKNIEIGIAIGFKEVKDFLYSYPFLNTNPFYAGLKKSPQFKELLRREKRKYQLKLKKIKDL
mgnify:CR=1 FL=1